MSHIVLDFETLGMPKDHCVVLSLSAVRFTQEELETMSVDDITLGNFIKPGRSIDIKFSAADQVSNYKRTVDHSTVEWWKKQSPEAMAIMRPSKERDTTLRDGIEDFLLWVAESNHTKNTHYWCRGLNFDMVLLESILDDLEIDHRFQFWNFRDTRSFISGVMLNVKHDCAPLTEEQMDGFIYHNSVHDCAKDAMMIMMGMRYASGHPLPTENVHKLTVPKR